MSVNRKRKSKATTDGAHDFSAKKQLNEKIYSTADCDEIKGQNSTVKRQINIATCVKCVEGKEGHCKNRSTFYKTFDGILTHHQYEDTEFKIAEIRVGDENGLGLFHFRRLNKKGNLMYKLSGFKFGDKTDCVCHVNIHTHEHCGTSTKIEWLIEHQKIVHNIEYSTEFFKLDHESEGQNSKSDVKDKKPMKVGLFKCGECSSCDHFEPKFETLNDILNHICPTKNYRKFFGGRQRSSDCSIMGIHGRSQETLFLIEKSPHEAQTEFSSVICWLGNCFNSKKRCFNKVEDFIEHQKNEHNIEFSEKFMLKSDMETDNKDANVESTDNDIDDDEEEKDERKDQYCVECLEKSIRIQALENANDGGKTKLETEVASRKALEERCNRIIVEKNNRIIELLNRIQALEIANDDKKTKLETEIASRKALEESNTKYRKLRQGWAVKVFQSDPSNEDLDNLLSLEPEMLFKKYEQIMKETSSGRIKLEETTENLQDVKIKLKLQTEQREIYEKHLSQVREVLHLPAENCNFGNILPAVKVLIEQNETNHYTNSVANLEN